MTRPIPRMLTALGLSLALTGAHAQQDCNDHMIATAPDSRFEDYGDGTVIDLSAGLIWMQCAEGLSGAGCTTGSAQTFSWQQALKHAEAAAFAGSTVWRLPNNKELASLVELRCYDPAINERRFPNTPSGSFWSSSPYADGPNYEKWSVNFFLGEVVIYAFDSYVRLVRARR